jgi:hypothetical protein
MQGAIAEEPEAAKGKCTNKRVLNGIAEGFRFIAGAASGFLSVAVVNLNVSPSASCLLHMDVLMSREDKSPKRPRGNTQ